MAVQTQRTASSRASAPLESRGCASCPGRNRVWRALGAEGAALLEQAQVPQKHRAGQVLFHQGSPATAIHCIESGTVGIRKVDSEGNTRLVRLAGPGDLVGHRAWFDGGTYAASAHTLTDTTACFLETRRVEEILRDNPSALRAFAETLAHDLGNAEELALLTARASADARVLGILGFLADRAGSPKDGNERTVVLPMSRQELAEMAGIRPETLARAIRRLGDAGAARFQGRRVTLRTDA